MEKTVYFLTGQGILVMSIKAGQPVGSVSAGAGQIPKEQRGQHEFIFYS